MCAASLTIGIPTYNRADDLRVALESILVQIGEPFRCRINIFISDNASTDATQDVIFEYSTRYPDLVTSQRHPTNLGFSRNVDSVIRQAQGDFVLLLGDDDGLDDHCLEKLLEIIDRYANLGVVFLSETRYDSELHAPVQPPFDPAIDRDDTHYCPGLEYVRQTRIFPPFLVSGYVIRREAWIKAMPGDFAGTICIHSLTTLRILLQYDAYASFSPSIRYRVENNKQGNRWLDELYPFTFHLDLLVGCRGVKATYPPKLYRCLHRQAMRSVVYHIMDAKVTAARLNVPLLGCRLKELADAGDPLVWLARFLLLMPAIMIRMPFKIALFSRSIMKTLKAKRR